MTPVQTGRVRFSDDDLAPLLFFVALTVLACLTPAQNDTFWHLRSGQYMWQTRSVIASEPFSHTAFGAPLNNHWWLSQVAFYLVYALGGPFLLTLAVGLTAVAAVAGSWKLAEGSWELRLGLLAWLIVATAAEWSIRPQVVSLGLLVLAARLITRGRVAWLPLVCLVWANAHAMVIFGVVMSGAALIEALLWGRERAPRAALVAFACVLAPTVSPLGWQYWPQILATVTVSRELQIQEYRPPFALADLPFWVGAGTLALLIVTGRSRLNGLRPGARTLIVAAVILSVSAVAAARNIAFFAVVAAPAIASLWPASSTRPRKRAPAGPVPVAIAGAAIVAGVFVVASAWGDGGARRGWQPLSPLVVDAVRRCPDPIFNQMEDGGPLMWFVPERRVFVDSRMEAYPLQLLRRSRDVDLGGDHRALFSDYRIGCAIVTTGSALGARLSSDPSFETLYSDSGRTVLAKASGES
jgi:hypothetical protein